MRLLVAIAFLGGWVAAFAAGPPATDGAALATWAGLGLGAGALYDRWRAVLLAPGYALVAVAFDVAAACTGGSAEPRACDRDVVGLVLLVELPAMALTLACGVALRKALRWTLRR
ncbi:hypothetical protein [Conexibacter sp. SYSU D00693]|uniref:hypothetical protein n=1 Tax=Conexibacter sp. SYSU D00693 TaxID=2812560 RepID=UPI00196A7348|nr:hypothetical protein [Conexibacter sp. SYSU D00693]